ncbi:hypothetical protein [Clostridium sp. BNL1100]|uniref:hypothetical protein n=1 Tax=Clostridium sp. BNL1100 TaxID=755731 RepID=UPI0003034693|nr:hypothetical protein [Clostridium sp. BNL1100]
MKYGLWGEEKISHQEMESWGYSLFILVQVETQVIISEIPLSTAVFNNFELPTFYF